MGTEKHVSATLKYRSRVHILNPWGAEQTVLFYSSSEMASQSHPGWRSQTQSDAGGPFYLRKDLDEHVLGTASLPLFEGNFACGYPTGFSNPFVGYTVPSNSALDVLGTTAIARTEPTRSASDVATFIGELRADGLPRLRPETMKSVTKSALNARSLKKQGNAAGSDYLNVEFGWKPFVSDLRKMARAVIQSHDILQNYRKHGSGQKMRRRFAFPTKSESYSKEATNFLPIPANSALGFGTGTLTVRRQQDTWFAGCFRYYVPVADSQIEKFAVWRSNAQKLLGVDLTPETVWNVSPWSWLVDWQSNTGDVLHNISAMGRDGLVMQYGYMMSHTVFTGDRAARFAAGWASGTSTTDIKLRRPATPYGFGVDVSALTGRQSAILAALGLSRA